MFRLFNGAVFRLILAFGVGCGWACLGGRAQIGGVDTMQSAEWVAGLQPEVLASWLKSRAWIRLSALPDPGSKDLGQLERVASEVAALRSLTETNIRILARIRWGSNSWEGGVRPGGGKRVPLDLREAFERARRYAETYGEWVDAFEFENEPDIAFVQDNAETYTAYLKACYLGVKAGAKRPAIWRRWAEGVRRFVGLPMREPQPWVAMAPLALPPGPYLERMVANGLWSHTDVFNFHYYGFAEDFSGVYRQFEDAVGASENAETLKAEKLNWVDARAESLEPRPGTAARRLPVLLSEYGYGSLGEAASKEVEGRVRQWAWFREVTEQIREQRVAGPMAFTSKPGLERGVLEFGIAAAARSDAGNAETLKTETLTEQARDGRPETGDLKPEKLEAGGVEFRVGDFGTEVVEPWMTRIGQEVGDYEAMPALAWLMEFGEQNRYRPGDWKVAAETPGAVVIDFVAGGGLTQVKRYRGYVGTRAAVAGRSEAEGELVLYNFSEKEVRGKLRVSGEVDVEIGGDEETVKVGPGERLSMPVRLRIPAHRFAAAKWSVEFVAERGRGRSGFETSFFPGVEGMREQVVRRLDYLENEATESRVLLQRRELAREEPASSPSGRWLVTSDVKVEERPGRRWLFSVAASEDGTRGRAMAELPLPDDFEFPEDALLRLSHRLVQPGGTTVVTGKNLQIYFRTANGNLFVVWPWSRAQGSWSDYLEAKGNFTMAFYGRAALPWRFSENRIVSLVFAFAPERTPMVFEVQDPRIVRVER